MAMALPIAAAATAAVGSIYQGNAAAAANNSAADVAAGNANTARLQGGATEELQRRHNAKQMGIVRAAAAESGFDPSSGSLAKLQTDSAANMELDALTTRYEANLKALSFDNEASGYRARAKAARRTGYLNAVGTLAQAGASYSGGMKFGGSQGLLSTGDFTRMDRGQGY